MKRLFLLLTFLAVSLPALAQQVVRWGPTYNPDDFALSVPGGMVATPVYRTCVPLDGATATQQYQVELDASVCATNGSSPAGNGESQYCEISAPGMQIASETSLVIPREYANGQNISEGLYPGMCGAFRDTWTGVPTCDGHTPGGFGFTIQIKCTVPAFVPGGNNVSVYVVAWPLGGTSSPTPDPFPSPSASDTPSPATTPTSVPTPTNGSTSVSCQNGKLRCEPGPTGGVLCVNNQYCESW